MGAPARKLYTPEWMRVSEAAAQLGCHPHTIRIRAKNGELEGVRVVQLDRFLRINRADWAAYLERLASDVSKTA